VTGSDAGAGQGRAVAFGTGLLFAVGLGLAGMTDPARILAFLDVFGRWDPTLLFVMGGALLVHAASYAVIRRRSSPILAPRFYLPTRRDVTVPLVAGSAVFGVGWGLSGYCPGPAVVSLASGARPALVFTVGMLLGFALHARLRAPAPLSAPVRSE
jgi:uncharacterized membrane protein YedE/YeeE